MVETSSIKINNKTKSKLDKLKDYKRQSYDEIINKYLPAKMEKK